MKICLINSLYYPDTKGGVETVVKLIADEFSKKHDVFIICAGKERKTTTQENFEKTKIYRIGYEKYFSFHDIDQKKSLIRFFWRLNQLNNKYSSKTIYQILLKEKPDLILTHNTLGLGYNIISTINKYCSTYSSKHISTIHDVQLLYPSGILTQENKKRGLMLKLYSYITKNLYKSCKYIISPSQALLKLYTDNGFFANSDIKIIPNPLKFRININTIKSEDEKLRILYIGQLEKNKGVYDIIKAVRSLSNDKFYLTIAGRGKEEYNIRKIVYIVNNINFIGEYSNENMSELFKDIDIVVVPSVCFENSPMVIYEAFSHGIPVLASRIGGIPELIDENKTGWLFKPSDVSELRLKLEEIYKKKDRITSMSDDCKEKIKDFDVRKYCQKILDF